jgi:hypothetical protein
VKQLILTQFPWPWLPAAALLIFFAFFVIMVARISRKSQTPLINEVARMPFDEGEKHEP